MSAQAYKVSIPDHELIRPIGKGSYGEIWIAMNIMGTYRAVKVIHRNSFKDDRPYLRELEGIQRFEPISRTHEGFIHVLQIGNNATHAYFYYIMEIGDDKDSGQDINPESYIPHTLAHDLIDQDRLSYEACLHLGLALSDALSKLHRHGLVHRDIKPSNIIYVEGQPKLADIGLVTVIRDELSLVGTDGFIPPEGPGTPQGDIYSLGKVLYEVSTGKDRFQFPELPSLLEDLPDRESFLELNEVILSACHVDPAKRYASAEAMHADLAALQGGKSIRRLKQLEHRLEKFRKIAILAILVIGFVFSALLLYQNNQNQKTEIRQANVFNKLFAGNQFIESGEFAFALADYVEALQLDGPKSPRRDLHRLQIGMTLSQVPRLAALKFADERLNVVDWLPEKGRILSAGDAGDLTLWSIESQEPINRFKVHAGSTKAACFDPQGESLFTTGSDGFVYQWKTETGRLLQSYSHDEEIWDLAVHPDGHTLAVTTQSGRVLFIGYDSKFEVDFATDPLFDNAPARCLEFSPTGRYLVVGGDNGKILILDPTDFSIQSSFDLQYSSEIYSVSFDRTETQVVVGSSDNQCRVWSLESGEITALLPHEDRVVNARFSPDNRYIVTISFDGFARIWKWRENKLVMPLLHHSQTVVDAHFDETGRLILTACKDGTIRVWDLAGRKSPRLLRDNRLPGESFHQWILRNYNQVDSEHPPLTKTCLFWESQHYAQFPDPGDISRLTVHPFEPLPSKLMELPKPKLKNQDGDHGEPREYDFIALGNRYLLGVTAGQYVVKDLRDEQSEVQVRAIPFQNNTCGKWSPDGRWLVIGGWNGEAGRHEVRVIHAETGDLRYPPLVHEFEIRSFSWNPDQTLLAVNCSDGDFFGRPIHIWDFETGEQAVEPLYHLDGVYTSRFSPDGRLLVSTSEDDTALVRDFRTGKLLGLPMQHYNHVFTAEFSRDGRILFSARWNEDSIRIWEVSTGMSLSPWIPHWYIPTEVKFLDDIQMVVASTPYRGSHSGIHFLWKVESETKSIEVLNQMVRLLAGPNNQNAGSDPASHVASIKKAWNYVQDLEPGFSQTKLEEIMAWHLGEADECQYKFGRRDDTGALFHLNHLVKLDPENAYLKERIRQIEQLAGGSTSSSLPEVK